MAVVKKGELPSVIHNNECSEAIVKWGNAKMGQRKRLPAGQGKNV